MPKILCRYAIMLLAATALSSPAAVAAPTFRLDSSGAAQGARLGIAAIVGSDAISSFDVDNRVRFVIATAHLSNAPDVVEKLRPQVLQAMIDEKLELQEAEKNDIKISQPDIEQAIAAIEEQRGMPKDTIYHLLDSSHVPRETFYQQIKAQLAWNQLLAQKVRPRVHVSDDEIALASRHVMPTMKKNATHAVPDQLKISVITLPVDKPSHLREIKKLADKLVKEVRGGASFEEVSRQFSSVVKSSGGKVEAFWIKLTQLDPNIARVLSTATAGTVTDPLPSSEGFTIIKVYDVRTAAARNAPGARPEPEEKPRGMQVTMKEILLKLKPDAPSKEADMMLQVGQEVAKNPGTCDEKGVASVKDLQDFDIDVNFRTQMLDDLPPALKVIAEDLKAGEVSTPFASYEGIRLYMLCDKKEVDVAPVDRQEVYHMLLVQKMDLEAQKYIRNLRRETFIDIR